MRVTVRPNAKSQYAGKSGYIMQMQRGKQQWRIGAMDTASMFRLAFKDGRKLWFARKELEIPYE
jgi:hypothetical protein